MTPTGTRCAVVFRKVPDDDTSCLVIETDRLPDAYRDKIQEILNSKEAKDTNDLYEVLNRKTFFDGTNALQALHYKGMLKKVPVDSVTLVPFPGSTLPLALANAQIDNKVEEYNAKAETTKTPEPKTTNVDPLSDTKQIAAGLIVQAELLEQEAKNKRKEAYELDPSLRIIPEDEKRKKGRPPLDITEEERQLKAEQAKQKRRERDRANRAKKKAEREQAKKVEARAQRDANITASVDAKVMRDANKQ